jgi:hypothetical protein
MAKNGPYFIVDDDFSINRKNSKAVAQYLGEKYNLHEITAYKFSMFNFPLD